MPLHRAVLSNRDGINRSVPRMWRDHAPGCSRRRRRRAGAACRSSSRARARGAWRALPRRAPPRRAAGSRRRGRGIVEASLSSTLRRGQGWAATAWGKAGPWVVAVVAMDTEGPAVRWAGRRAGAAGTGADIAAAAGSSAVGASDTARAGTAAGTAEAAGTQTAVAGMAAGAGTAIVVVVVAAVVRYRAASRGGGLSLFSDP